MLRIAFIALTVAGIFAIFNAILNMAHDALRTQAASFQALAYSTELDTSKSMQCMGGREER